MPSTRFQALRPRRSLHRLRTALTHSSGRSRASSSASPSPISASSEFSGFDFEFDFDFNFELAVSSFDESLTQTTSPSTPHVRRVIQRKKSMAELEQEQERLHVDDALVGMLEPRPSCGPALGGIEEVIEGCI